MSHTPEPVDANNLEHARGELTEHLENLRAIRAVLTDHKRQGIIPAWMFVLWGLLIAAATSTQWAVPALQTVSSGLYLWIPVLLVGALSETASMLWRLGREDRPLFTPQMGRMLLFFIVVIIAGAGIAIEVVPHSGGPALVAYVIALCLASYAFATVIPVFIWSLAAALLGFALSLAGAAGMGAWLITGYGLAAVFVAAGAHTHFIDGTAGSE